MKKQAGRCIVCETWCYEVNERIEPSGTRLETVKLGAMLEHATQIEMLLSDGSCVHIDACVSCASKLEPEDYLAAWDAILDRTDERAATLRPNERQRALHDLARRYPLAVLRWRRQDPATGRLVVDRRYEGVVRG